jgi:hypothetical protein
MPTPRISVSQLKQLIQLRANQLGGGVEVRPRGAGVNFRNSCHFFSKRCHIAFNLQRLFIGLQNRPRATFVRERQFVRI